MSNTRITLAIAIIGFTAPAFGGTDSFSQSFAGPFSFTVGGVGSPLNAVSFGTFNVPAGTYHGLRVTYTVTATNTNARGTDVPVQLYLPINQVHFAPMVQSSISPYPVEGSINGGPVTYSFELPIFFYRAFNTPPVPYPGGEMLGMRGRNLTLNNTATWSDISFEFYEATVSAVFGDTFSSGSWNRPVVNPRQGIDLGRSSEVQQFTAIPFVVTTAGTYGIHSQFGGVFEGVTYLFEGDVPVTGDYSNLIDANSQGRWGVGHTDLEYSTLVPGQLYTLVQSGEDPDDLLMFDAWIVGPDAVTFLPLLGDLNCDFIVSVSDIGPFVLALTDPAGYAAQFPDCDINNADLNDDGFVTVGDIGAFVALLTGV